MALVIADNFNYQGKLPNFARDSFKTLADMGGYPETSIDEGHISICLETGKYYKFSIHHTPDPQKGRWKEIIDTKLDATSENPISNKALSIVLEERKKEITRAIEAVQASVTTLEEHVNDSVTDLDTKIGNVKTDLNTLETVLSAAINDLKASTIGSNVTINGHSLKSEPNLELTKADIGLGNVDNTSDLGKPVSTATQLELGKKVDKVPGKSLVPDTDITKLQELPKKSELDTKFNNISTDITNHTKRQDNPHNVTAAQVGLDSYSSYTPSTLPLSQTVKDELEKLVPTTRTINGHALTGDIQLTKDDINLNKVDNTSDLEKPVSRAQQEALDLKADALVTIKALGEIDQRLKDNEATIAKGINQTRLDMNKIGDKALELVQETVESLGNLTLNIDEAGNLIATY